MAHQAFHIEIRTNDKSRTVSVTGNEFVLGRSQDASVMIDCSDLSRRHLKIEVRGGQFFLTDLASTNGTFYKGVKVQPHKPFAYHGGEVRLGTPKDGATIRIITALEAESDLSSPSVSSVPSVSSLLSPPPAAPAPVASVPSAVPAPAPTATVHPLVNNIASVIVDLERQKRELEHEVDRMQARKAELAQNVERYEDEEKGLLRRIQKIAAEHAEVEAKFKEVDASYKSEQARFAELEAELRKQVETIEKSLYENAQSIDQLVSEHERKVTHLKSEQAAETDHLVSDHVAKIGKLQKEYANEWDRLVSEHQKKRAEVERSTDERIRAALEKANQEENKLLDDNKILAKKLKLEREAVEAEIRLKHAQSAKQIEELLTQRVGVERDLQVLREQLAVIRREIESRTQEKEKLHKEIESSKGEKESLDQNMSELSVHVSELAELKIRLERETTEQAERLRAEAVRTSEENAEARRKAEAEAARIIDEGRARAEKEYAALMDKRRAEIEEAGRVWQAELQARRQADSQELQLWKAEEERKVHEKLTADVDALVERIVNGAVAKGKALFGGDAAAAEAARAFTAQFKEALAEASIDLGTFNPDRKRSTRKFWIKAAASVAAAGVGVLLLNWIPQAVKREFLFRKQARFASPSDDFVKRIQAAREERLKLNLETREEFQADYVDNVLYNEAYLLVKTDPQIKQEWIQELNKVLIQDLGLREDAIVEFITIESEMINKLAEKRATLNAINKDAHVNDMQVIVQSHKSEMLQVLERLTMVGSEKAKSTNAQRKWELIRQFEKEFYASKAGQTESRQPASR